MSGAKGAGRRPSGIRIPSPEADELVALACDGDTEAFASLFRATVPILFKNLYGRCGDPTLTEDLVSDTYLRALRAMRRFDGRSRDFLAWLMRIGRNLFIDHVKSGRVRWEIVVDDTPVTLSTGDPEADAVASVEGLELRDALSELTSEQQEVVYLRFLEGMSIAETAQITGRTQGAVKALQFRALRSLERVLVDRGSFEDSWGAGEAENP